MKLLQIISEIEFKTYEAMVKFVYKDDSTSKIGELVRALPGVTTVTLTTDLGKGRQVFKVKLISQKSGQEAFAALKTNAMSKYSSIVGVEVAGKTIEKI
jgi:hypothetical protein|tara:strand:+ start:1383 stop:1679 length:297 start_codon:yes stop_codon:yes gene_type:complete